MAVFADDDNEFYNSYYGGLPGTPPPEPMKVRLQPSPSPQLSIPSSEVISDSSLDPPNRERPQRGSNHHRSQSSCPNQGDAYLIQYMDGGRNPDIAAHASRVLLAGDEEEEDDRHESNRSATAVDDIDKGKHQPSLAAFNQGAVAQQIQTAQELAATRRDNTAKTGVDGERTGERRPSIPSTSTYDGDARRAPSPDASLEQEVRTPSTGGRLSIGQHSLKSPFANGNGIGPVTLSIGGLEGPSHLIELDVIAHPFYSPLAVKEHSDSDSNGNSSESTVRGASYVGAKRKLRNNDSGNPRPTKRVNKLDD